LKFKDIEIEDEGKYKDDEEGYDVANKYPGLTSKPQNGMV